VIVLVALAGGLGAACRFLIDSALAARTRRNFPVGTLVINVTGSFLLGLLVGWAQQHGPGAEPARAVLGTGFLGGYTTFSTASVELVRLTRAGRRAAALGLACGMLGFSVAAAAAGVACGTRL